MIFGSGPQFTAGTLVFKSCIILNRMVHIFIYEKVLLVLAMVFLAIYNSQDDYASQYPRRFFIDALTTGIASSAVAATMASFRGASVGKSALFAFLFFFFFSICREFSGYYAILGKEHKTITDKNKRVRQLAILAVIVFTVSIGYLAYRDRVQPHSKFPFELLIVTAIMTIGDGIVAMNHGILTNKMVILDAILFVIGNILLQYSGLYKEIFAA